MEHFLAQCGAFVAAGQYPFLLSIMLGGLVGSFSHCSVMCSPLVSAQMFMLQVRRQPPSRIGFYHAGRVATYALLGATAVYAGQWFFGGAFARYAHGMLLLAGFMFLASALIPTKTHACCSSKLQRLQQWLSALPWPRTQHFMRGMLMGLIPCGLLVSVLLVVGTLSSPLYAAVAMVAFGVSTVPVLQLAARAALSLGNRYPRLGAPLGRAVMAGNGIILCGIGLNLVRVG